jgi:hypothetical protein
MTRDKAWHPYFVLTVCFYRSVMSRNVQFFTRYRETIDWSRAGGSQSTLTLPPTHLAVQLREAVVQDGLIVRHSCEILCLESL